MSCWRCTWEDTDLKAEKTFSSTDYFFPSWFQTHLLRSQPLSKKKKQFRAAHLPSGFSTQSPQSRKPKHQETNFASSPRSLQDKSCFEPSKAEVHPVPGATSGTEAPQQHLGWHPNVFLTPLLPTLLFHRSHSHSTGRFLQCLCLLISRIIQNISGLGHSFSRWTPT